MTVTDACTLLADMTRELALARAEAHAYRLVAQAGIHHAHDLHVENQLLRRQLDQLRDEPRRPVSRQVVSTAA